MRRCTVRQSPWESSTLALDRYHVAHAVRADLLRRLGRRTEAADEYTLAAEQTGNDVERQFLLGCRDELSSP